MWSTVMARNFPSPLCSVGACGGGSTNGGNSMMAAIRRRRNPNSTTRGLLVPPLSPLYSCIQQQHQKYVLEQQEETKKVRTVEESAPTITTASSLEIDTGAELNPMDDETVENEQRAMTPRSSSLRRTQRNLPSPSPTLATVSCDSSSSSSLCSSSKDNASCKSPKRRSVTFGTVEIREHPRILGDNPSVKRGPALSLGWYSHASCRQFSYDVNVYEAIRSNQRRSNIVLSSATRKKLLLRHNVTHSDMRQSKLEIAKIKRSRRHHNSTCSEYDDTMVVMEQCLQTMQGIFTGRLADWELAKLMKQAQLAEQQQQLPAAPTN